MSSEAGAADGLGSRRADFEALFASNADPWGYRARWYEVRKRALTVACLPRERFERAYEPGCAVGELSAMLAPRCGQLLISDGSETAIKLARLRVASSPNVEATVAWLPADWPDGLFDLIVLSEWLYYVPVEDLDLLVAKVRACLGPDGIVVACHWRAPIAGCSLDGDAVHARLAAGLSLPHLSSLQEHDFRLDVWGVDPDSVARREGLV